MKEKVEVKKALGLFRDLLNASWPTVLNFEKESGGEHFNDFRINWLQGNWELTVEQNLLEGPFFFQIYGEGADFGGKSSRVCFSDALPTHHILCRPKSDGILLSGNLTITNPSANSSGVIFECFAKMTETGWFEESPPFDCVIGNQGDKQVLFKFEDAEFSLAKIGA